MLVVGAGYMGSKFARLCAAWEDVRLVGICDLDVGRARALTKDLGGRALPELGDALALDGVQAVIVATPEEAHEEACLAAARAGLPALVEKPLAADAAAARRIRDAFAVASVPCMVGHVLRFDARYRLARQAVRAGELGEVRALYARRLNGRSAQDRLHGRCSLAMFLGVHEYDLVRWFFGHDPVRVYAQSTRGILSAQGYPVADTTSAMLTFADGALAVVESGWILPPGWPSGREQRFELDGTAGRLNVLGTYEGLALGDLRGTRFPDTTAWPELGGSIAGSLARELDHFLRCVRLGTTPEVTAEDGYQAVRIAEAVDRSAESGVPEPLTNQGGLRP